MSERDKLDKERYLIDLHLYGEERKDKLAIQARRLADLGELYKNAGYLKDAICEMKRSLLITKNENHKSVLTEWENELGVPEKRCPYDCGHTFSQSSLDLCPGCKRLIAVCSMCSSPNRVFDLYCRWCGIEISKPSVIRPSALNFMKDWFYPALFEYLSFPPVTVGDVIVVPTITDRNLLALKLSNGHTAWEVKNLLIDKSTKLTFFYPYLYIFSMKRVERIMMGLRTMTPKVIYYDSNFDTNYPTFPLLDGKIIYFPVSKGLLIHNLFRSTGSLMQMDIEKDDALFPIKVGGDIFVFSKKGKIYKLSSDEMNLSYSVSLDSVSLDCEIASPPISPTGSNWVYLESYSNGQRKIIAWTPGTRAILSKVLRDTLCSLDDIHFHNPPLLYKDGVLLISCQGPELYYARSIGWDIDLREINVNIRTGIRKVLNIEYLFSLIIEPYFISGIPDGFFYVNLENTNDNGVEFFNTEMRSRPLVFNNRLIFLCKDGVRCYTF